MHLGIDFGTCFSSAALHIDGEIKLVKEPIKLGYSFPSSVFLDKSGELLVGQAAENKKRLAPDRYIAEFKRDLGKTTPYMLGDHQFLPEELITEMLRVLKQEAEVMCSQSLSTAVLTIPASYQAHKQGLMEKAARDAGFSEIHFLIEPVAAALYYEKSVSRERALAEGDTLLVYDLGGGTFDAALLEKRGETFELLVQPVGDQQLGGIDFDRAIYQHLLSTCSKALREQLQCNDVKGLRVRHKVVDWVREFKHQLSITTEHIDELPIGDMEVFELTRSRFEELINPKLYTTWELCSSLLSGSKISPESINKMLMVGGSCRIPHIKETAAKKFRTSIERVDDPELAVCLGAVIPKTNMEVTQKNDNNQLSSQTEDRSDKKENSSIFVTDKDSQIDTQKYSYKAAKHQVLKDEGVNREEWWEKYETYETTDQKADKEEWWEQYETPDQKVYIYNLPYSVTENDLREVCSEFGIVSKVYLSKDKKGKFESFGLVEMSTENSALAMIEALDDAEWCGCKLHLRFACEIC